jgi:hypothetical protein
MLHSHVVFMMKIFNILFIKLSSYFVLNYNNKRLRKFQKNNYYSS